MVLWADEPNVKVHKGFGDSWTNLRPYVYQALNRVRALCPTCTLTVGGHSLGAAMATLAAVDFTRSGIKVRSYWPS